MNPDRLDYIYKNTIDELTSTNSRLVSIIDNLSKENYKLFSLIEDLSKRISNLELSVHESGGPVLSSEDLLKSLIYSVDEYTNNINEEVFSIVENYLISTKLVDNVDKLHVELLVLILSYTLLSRNDSKSVNLGFNRILRKYVDKNKDNRNYLKDLTTTGIIQYTKGCKAKGESSYYIHSLHLSKIKSRLQSISNQSDCNYIALRTLKKSNLDCSDVKPVELKESVLDESLVDTPDISKDKQSQLAISIANEYLNKNEQGKLLEKMSHRGDKSKYYIINDLKRISVSRLKVLLELLNPTSDAIVKLINTLQNCYKCQTGSKYEKSGKVDLKELIIVSDLYIKNMPNN